MQMRFLPTSLLVVLSLASAAPLAVNAELPGRHPGYLHAMADLRQARYLLLRPDFGNVDNDENHAVAEIDACMNDLFQASISDGKNVNEHPGADLVVDLRGRLHKGLDALEKARHDMEKEEDDPMTRGLQSRAIGHVNRAIGYTKKAIHDKFKDQL